MRDQSEYHPDFLANWKDRVFEYIHELSDPSFQNDVWVHATRPGIQADFVEFVCGLFDDQDVRGFLKHFHAALKPEVFEALLHAVNRVEQFSDSLGEKEVYQPQDWIDSDEWKACVRSGQRAVEIITEQGWFQNNAVQP